ncbi:MAG: type II toxin-antitoxin system YafQ family toxin [Candidatus Eisenbacteria sp.]|nr:type II toxin-antitoxin system YafQ family toxin [Candidatus Eisenbacteria bacterium]
MRNVSQTTQFVRDVKRMRKRGKDLEKLKILVAKLANGELLDPKHWDHPLIGQWKSARDCHIEPDWVLIYSADAHSLRLERTGSHNDLFKK